MMRYNESLDAYNKLVQIDPTSGTAWMAKGDILESMGNHEDALDSYREAKRSPLRRRKRIPMTQAHGWKNGKALVKLGRYDEALRAYDGAINNSSPYIGNTQKSEAWTGKGNVLQAQNKAMKLWRPTTRQ